MYLVKVHRPLPRSKDLEPHLKSSLTKLYQVTEYEKQYTRFAVTCRYQVAKEYITPHISNQEILEIAFVVVSPPGNSLELYIYLIATNPPHHGVHPSSLNTTRQSLC